MSILDRSFLADFKNSVCYVFCNSRWTECRKVCKLKEITVDTINKVKISDLIGIKEGKK